MLKLDLIKKVLYLEEACSKYGWAPRCKVINPKWAIRLIQHITSGRSIDSAVDILPTNKGNFIVVYPGIEIEEPISAKDSVRKTILTPMSSSYIQTRRTKQTLCNVIRKAIDTNLNEEVIYSAITYLVSFTDLSTNYKYADRFPRIIIEDKNLVLEFDHVSLVFSDPVKKTLELKFGYNDFVTVEDSLTVEELAKICESDPIKIISYLESKGNSVVKSTRLSLNSIEKILLDNYTTLKTHCYPSHLFKLRIDGITSRVYFREPWKELDKLILK